MKKIGVIGSINVDYITRVEMQPKVGETVSGYGLDIKPGGKGANQAYAAAASGANVTMFGAIGNDESGALSLRSLTKAGVNTEYIKVADGVNTGTAFISVNKDGDNSIIVIPGANNTVDREYIDSVSDQIGACDIIIFQLEIPLDTVIYAIEKCKKFGKTIILDPAPATKLPKEVLDGIDYVKPNQTEFTALLGKTDAGNSDIKSSLQEMKECGIITPIITLGKDGVCSLDSNGEHIHIAAYPVHAIDTTGAGDCFTGAMAACLAEDKTLKESLDFASKAAALSVMKEGAQSSYPMREDVLKFTNDHQEVLP